MKITSYAFLSLAVVMTAVACGDDGDEPTPNPTGTTPTTTTTTTGAGAGGSSTTATTSTTTSGTGGMLPTCTEDLDPQEGPTDLVITEVSLGNYIELHNPTGADITTGSTYEWCSRPDYISAAAITVPAGGYVTVNWPATFNSANATDGEIALYNNGSNYGNADFIADFVCWGNANQPNTRKDTAEAAGEWTGDCAPSLTNGVIKRNMSNSGNDAASWDSTVMEDPTDCAP